MTERRNMKEWISCVIAEKNRIAIPIMTHPGIEMIGRSIREAVQSGECHADAIFRLHTAYPSAATTVIMDLTLEAEAFGCQIDFPENDMPHIKGRLVSTEEEIRNLRVPELTQGRIPEYLKANELSTQRITDRPIFAGAIGPFSLAGRLYDMSEIMVACYMEPDAIGMLLDKCTELIINYCTELKKVGCNGVVVAEPAAGLLSNEDCLMFSSIYIRRLVEAVQDDTFIVVLHNCGNKGQCTAAMLETGAAAYHFGNAAHMKSVLEACPANVLVMGNVDPVGVLKMKTPAEIKRITLDLLEETAAFPNFVLSTGCDLPPHVPIANINAFYEALNEYNDLHVGR